MTNAIMTAQSIPTTAASQFIPIGLDVGNGAVKMFSAMGETLMESYVLYLNERATHSNIGYVEYLEGSRSELSGKQWIGGENAYYQSPSGITRVTDDKDGKAQLCLQLLLSTLTMQSYRPEWNLSICASVHDGKVFGKAIKQALDGTHKIRMNGKQTIVNIRVDRVLEEGSGVAVALNKSFDFKNALLFDLGNGTSIVSAFNGLQLTDRDYASDAGVEKLIDAIATCDIVRKHLLTNADRHLIRQGIEKGDFSYGTRNDSWNFKDAYISELPKWFNSGLKPLLKKAESRIGSATAVIAVGGGSQLPGVKSMLSKLGIEVQTNARFLNSKGLYQVALRGVE